MRDGGPGTRGNARAAMLCAALLALAFSGLLLRTPDPFVGSGTDLVAFGHPNHAFAAARLARGDLPLWNPYALGGLPFQTGVHSYLSPSFWSAVLLPPFTDIKLGIILHLVFAATGAAWAAHRRCHSTPAAILAGVTFALSGFMVSHLFAGHLRHVFTAAYLPWVFGLTDAALARGGRWIAAAGFACGVMILCGFYPFVFIAAPGVAVFFLLELALDARPEGRRGLLRGVAVLAAVAAIGAALAMVQLLPLVESLGWSQRAAGDPAFAAENSSAPLNLMTFLFPHFFGNDRDVPFFGSWTWWESMGFLGLAPLALVLAAPLVLPLRRWLPAALVFAPAITLSLGPHTPFFDAYLAVVPGADLFRAPGRFLLLATLFGSLLAATTLAHWQSAAPPVRRRALVPLVVLPLLAALVWLWLGGESAGDWEARWSHLVRARSEPLLMDGPDWLMALRRARGDAARATLILASVIAMLVLAARLSRRAAVALLIAAVTAVDLFAFGRRFLSTGPAELFEWPPALVEFLQRHHEPGLRIIDDPLLWSPGRGAVHGVAQIGGYETLISRDYVRYLNRARGASPDDFLAFAVLFERNPLIDRLGPRFLLAAEPLAAGRSRSLRGYDGWEGVGRFGGVHVYRNPAPHARALLAHAVRLADEDQILALLADPRIDLRDAVLLREPPPPGIALADPGPARHSEAARIVRYEPDLVEIEVDAAADALVVLSDNWHPGWHAWVDDRRAPVIPANLVMRAVPVPPGRHFVRMRFLPGSFVLGAAISVAALVSLAVWLAASRHAPRIA